MGDRKISDIAPKRWRFTEMIYFSGILLAGGKPIAVWVQSITGCVNSLVVGAILSFCPGHHTRHKLHTTHALSPKGSKDISDISPRRPHFTKKNEASTNTADVTGGKSIAVRLQSISGMSAVHPFVAFYDIHGRKREVVFFCSVPDTTRDLWIRLWYYHRITIYFNYAIEQRWSQSDVPKMKCH
jgi:hypothetical protein